MQTRSEFPAALFCACLLSWLSACDGRTEPAVLESPDCGSDGRLVGEIYGSVRASIEWGRGTLRCEGMPRPNGEGARLRFAGPAVADGEELKLAFILALPDLVEGETAAELQTSVTMIEEGNGEFFATRDASSCWTDIDTHERMQVASTSEYRISGVLYCVAPLANLNDNSSVSFADLRFSGRLDWTVPE